MKLISTTLCFFLIFSLFWMERKKEKGVSWALWIPFIWIFFAGSRQLSQWLSGETFLKISYMQLERNPLNVGLFWVLIIAGLVILARRRLNWKEIFFKNIWVWLFFIFGAISIIWSDYQIVAFKRLIKSFGTVIMALVILSEERPYEALGTILKRIAFLLLPLSFLLIKYYPNLGRGLVRIGETMYTGVAVHKNSLGQLCMILGIYFCWSLLFDRRKGLDAGKRPGLFLYFVISPIFTWLLYKADSATSMVCLAVAIGFLLFARIPWVFQRPYRILASCITIMAIFTVMQLFFGDVINRNLIALLSRNEYLSGRTLAWVYLKSHAGNHWVGVGYESFWLGSRLEEVWERFGQPFYQAHNGYLETYLNLGLIGLSLIVCNIFSGLLKAWKDLSKDFAVGILRLSLIIVVVLYNYTESTFSGVSNMLLLFWIGAVDPALKSRGARI